MRSMHDARLGRGSNKGRRRSRSLSRGFVPWQFSDAVPECSRAKQAMADGSW
jgi:hypothetical protein